MTRLWVKNGSSSRRVSWPLHLQLRKEPAAPVRTAGTRSSAHSADDFGVPGELHACIARCRRHFLNQIAGAFRRVSAARTPIAAVPGGGESILELGGGIKFRLDQAQTRSIAVPS